MPRRLARLLALAALPGALSACDTPAPPADVGSPAVDAARDVPAVDAPAPLDHPPVDDDATSPMDASVPDATTDATTTDLGTTCAVDAPTSCPPAPPRFGDVEPIIQARCINCHYGAIGGPWPLIGYEHVADWQDTIRDQLLNCSMPPADAGALTDDERNAILVWLRCGLPR